ncbi:tetratricopeptide repeat protein, partial [bacterium]|nr:tetratricopeptide repeat protein [bacterium]
MHTRIANIIVPGVGLLLLVAVACGPSAGTAVTDGEQNAHWQRAKRLIDRREFADAAAAYRQALRDNPDFASVHLELGLLYDDKLGDPIAAIYHYRQYLELHPGSPKRQVVEDFIERAKLTVAAKLPQSSIVDPSELGRLQSERAELIRQNSALRARLAELEHTRAYPAPVPAP